MFEKGADSHPGANADVDPKGPLYRYMDLQFCLYFLAKINNSEYYRPPREVQESASGSASPSPSPPPQRGGSRYNIFENDLPNDLHIETLFFQFCFKNQRQTIKKKPFLTMNGKGAAN